MYFVCVHMCVSTIEDKSGTLRTLELESQEVVSHLTWVQGTGPGLSTRQQVLFPAAPSLQPPLVTLASVDVSGNQLL